MLGNYPTPKEQLKTALNTLARKALRQGEASLTYRSATSLLALLDEFGQPEEWSFYPDRVPGTARGHRDLYDIAWIDDAGGLHCSVAWWFNACAEVMLMPADYGSIQVTATDEGLSLAYGWAMPSSDGDEEEPIPGRVYAFLPRRTPPPVK